MSTNETVHPEGLPKDLNISNIISLALESPEHLEYLQGFALRNSEISARFARHVPGANIDNLQVRHAKFPNGLTSLRRIFLVQIFHIAKNMLANLLFGHSTLHKG